MIICAPTSDAVIGWWPLKEMRQKHLELIILTKEQKSIEQQVSNDNLCANRWCNNWMVATRGDEPKTAWTDRPDESEKRTHQPVLNDILRANRWCNNWMVGAVGDKNIWEARLPGPGTRLWHNVLIWFCREDKFNTPPWKILLSLCNHFKVTLLHICCFTILHGLKIH